MTAQSYHKIFPSKNILGECRTLWDEREWGSSTWVVQCGCFFVPSLSGCTFLLA